MTVDPFAGWFSGRRVMAILRGLEPEAAVTLAERAWDCGLDCVEVTVERPSALPSLRAVVAAGRQRGLDVGAGTVVGIEQVRAAASAGAAFTVAPGLDLEVAAASEDAGMPHLPGVATPTEVQRAVAGGHRWLKVFPATVLGPGWLRALRGPFPEVNLVATGGIDASNAAEYLAAGADVVAVGSALADPAQLPQLATLACGKAPGHPSAQSPD